LRHSFNPEKSNTQSGSFIDKIIGPLKSQEPAYQLIRQTARAQWRLVTLNVTSNLVGALSEGGTLAVVFLAVEVLSASAGTDFDWRTVPGPGWIPVLAGWLNGLPSTSVFLGLLVLAVLLQALQSLTRYLNQVSVGYFAARCRADVTKLIHGQVLKMSFSCASCYKVGDFTDYAAQGPIAIKTQIEETSSLTVGVLLCLTYLAVLVRISPVLLLAVVIIGGLVTVIQKKLIPRIRAGSRAVSLAEVEISKRITEDFQALRLLHTTGELQEAETRLATRMGELEGQLRNQVKRMSFVGPLTSLLPIVSIAVIAALSLLFAGADTNNVLPSLVTFVLGLQKLGGRINIITTNLNQLANNNGRFQRLNRILTKEGKEFRQPGGITFNTLENSVRFSQVFLRYKETGSYALSNISFNLEKGKMVALVGASGSGKSSIADLLVGLYQPTLGKVLIDGINMNELDLTSWQKRLGVVSQDTFLFNGTIAENIAFGAENATRRQVEAACISAQAAGFIEALPEGYDTLVGERGYRLSGGQRQRLSLARAILRNPEVLILDEATSALDSRSEKMVQEAIERFEKSHTVLVIAHRLSTVAKADEIIVLDKGKIIERGEHQGLVSSETVYRSMWLAQTNGTAQALT
jgi:ATP-binding cassette, subfamily B, bacterial MsbA